MAVDFRAEVEKRKDAMVKGLFVLLRINSERNDSRADKEHPLGPGSVKALGHLLAMAERDGCKARNIDNYASDFEFGEGDEVLGVFAHLDVVPAGSDWGTDPYEPVIRDGCLYAHGSSDNKDPTMACYCTLEIVKELDLPVSKKVRFIVDTDEEPDWGDMEYYFTHNGLKDLNFGFSLDAEFPIINGGKGNITEFLHFADDNNGAFTLDSFDVGPRDNMVPKSATAILTADSTLADLQEKLVAFTAAGNPEAELAQEGDAFRVAVIGKSAYDSTPELSLNAAAYLAEFLDQFASDDATKVYLDTTANILHKDFAGKNLGVAYTNAEVSALGMNAGIFRFDHDSDGNTITSNSHYPQGTDAQTIKAELEKLADVTKMALSDHERTPHYVPADDPLVSTLLSVYKKQTGLKGYEQVIGDDTFGRLLKRGVAFGVMFPDYVSTMHQTNEFTDVDGLCRVTTIYAEALYELIR